MTMSADARAFRDLLADPAAAETLSAVTGCPLAVVEISSAAEGGLLSCLDTTIPAVVVVLSADPEWPPSPRQTWS